jgi:hypothetical protein
VGDRSGPDQSTKPSHLKPTTVIGQDPVTTSTWWQSMGFEVSTIKRDVATSHRPDGARGTWTSRRRPEPTPSLSLLEGLRSGGDPRRRVTPEGGQEQIMIRSSHQRPSLIPEGQHWCPAGCSYRRETGHRTKNFRVLITLDLLPSGKSEQLWQKKVLSLYPWCRRSS